ncbi:integrin beta-8 isoform X2 [Chiloscyllium plagiosum]|uniref:integrin beta-8 isoform X2 n=1 Tax=Chiloscyllium plagiosum TaxID=36176 RepID=UPI001CB7B237|nr:integrin beta-8 isoform X2 [Chiloscyllium plagiosum]
MQQRVLILATGSLPKPRHFPAKVFLSVVHILTIAVAASKTGVRNKCTAEKTNRCSDCLLLGPECGWCFQKEFSDKSLHRCDLVANLIEKGCKSDFIEFIEVEKIIEEEESQNSQLTPGKVSLHLRPGSEMNFVVRVQQLDKYPVDLYHLVDTSASMVANLERLHSMGHFLSQKMAKYSSDFRFGFGSFVDKPVSPFINIHPEKLINPCSIYETSCLPAHGFKHVLSLTNNISEFRKAVERQRISGNEDTPEGGLDAMLQVAVCENQIGWRKEAKHLLLMITDQLFHLALDSKLGGIVLPNDGNCHLQDNMYTHSTIMEHPSVGLLVDKLLENSIHVIFAVQGSCISWYKDLLPLMPGAVARQLNAELSNLSELVESAYRRLLSEVELQVDNQINGVYVNITAICPDGTKHQGQIKCRNVKANDAVLFNVTVGMTDCFEGDNYINLKPVGYNETTVISISSTCACQCKGQKGYSAGKCFNKELDPDCRLCHCEDKVTNSSCKEQCLIENCRQKKGQAVCSNRGICNCGKCLCYQSNLGRVFGKYCELDDFSCPNHHGRLCAGNGECKRGECQCYAGWEGESCNCSSSLMSCRTGHGQICNGRGTCICGRCHCTESRTSGHLCEVCPTCESSCENSWKCVQCHVLNYWAVYPANCTKACSQMVLVDQLSESEEEKAQHCIFQAQNNCLYKFKMVATDTEKEYLYILRNPEYYPSHNIVAMFLVFSVGTVITGLFIVMIIRQIMMHWNSNETNHPGTNCKVSPPQKGKTSLPIVSSETTAFRRDKPEELHVYINKMQVISEA